MRSEQYGGPTPRGVANRLWLGRHLHRFEIRGREYAVYRDGGGMIGIDATAVQLCDLKLRRLERFVYEYDFGDSWIHDLRLETTLPVNPRNIHPLCVVSARGGTPRIHARFWCGDVTRAQASRLEIDIGTPGDLFAEAVRRGSDLQIQNIRDPKIAARLPPYFTAAFPQTASFIVLPIVSGDSPIACILVGRDVPETGPISSEDIGLLRAVRGQIILAMKTVR